MYKEFESFIDSRLQSNLKQLRNSKKWKNLNSKYSILYEDLFQKLSSSDKKVFENIYSLYDDLVSQEVYLAYKIGLLDGIKLNNDIE